MCHMHHTCRAIPGHVVRVISSMVISAPVLGNPKKQYSSTQVLEYSEYSKYSSTGTRVLEYSSTYSRTLIPVHIVKEIYMTLYESTRTLSIQYMSTYSPNNTIEPSQ